MTTMMKMMMVMFRQRQAREEGIETSSVRYLHWKSFRWDPAAFLPAFRRPIPTDGLGTSV
jgi:hypothetical protein